MQLTLLLILYEITRGTFSSVSPFACPSFPIISTNLSFAFSVRLPPDSSPVVLLMLFDSIFFFGLVSVLFFFVFF